MIEIRTVGPKMKWPSRERWAEIRRSLYWDSETGCPFRERFGHQLSDYATQEEIAMLTTAVKELWRDYGRKLRAAKPPAPLCPQRGECNGAYYQRYKTMTEDNQKIISKHKCLKADRKEINRYLSELQENSLPSRYQMHVPEVAALLAPFQQKYDTAFNAAWEEWKREIMATPIDDAAWEEELQERRELWEAHPDWYEKPTA